MLLLRGDFVICKFIMEEKEKFLIEYNKFCGMVNLFVVDMEYLVSKD